MALYHDATVTPSKPELAASWLSKQSWFDRPASPIEVIGAFRFDDPEGRVGLETHLLRCGDIVLQAPMSYRDAPLAGGEDWLIGTTEHSVLGTRWVYDGHGDPRYLTLLAAVTMTGQGEALGMVVYDGEWFIAPAAVRIECGGWSQERVSVDGFELVEPGSAASMTFRNHRFALTVHRHVLPEGHDVRPMQLTATWAGAAGRVLLAEVAEVQ